MIASITVHISKETLVRWLNEEGLALPDPAVPVALDLLDDGDIIAIVIEEGA